MTQEMTPAERKAFYRGRADAFAGDIADYIGCQTSGERENYARGYRQARAEDRLSADREWG